MRSRISSKIPQEGLKRDLVFVAVCMLVVVSAAGLHNITTPDERIEVGTVEVDTRCTGIDAGICLGLERRYHRTYNYENWTDPEPGSEQFYRRVEAELMTRAYNTCGGEVSGMEWTSRVEYRNRTAEEWRGMDQVELLPCEKTLWRNMSQN